MDIQRLQELIEHPNENLNREIKRWIDPNSPEGKAKIIKGIFALYNRDGGEFIIGFDDKSSEPDVNNVPADVRRTFHNDVIQLIVSQYASEKFEIEVKYPSRSGQEYPVILVPQGVQVPVSVKRPLQDGAKKLLEVGDVYFRSLSSNGIASSTKARDEDWKEIVRLCISNADSDLYNRIVRHGKTEPSRKLILSFDRDATKTFWLTFDGDNNRNISQYDAKRDTSYSMFCVTMTAVTNHDAQIHGVDMFVYHNRENDWVKLHDQPGPIFGKPSIERSFSVLHKDYPIFRPTSLNGEKSTIVQIPKAGCFRNSLTSEFLFRSHQWGDKENLPYACLGVVLRLDTKFLLITCLVPGMGGYDRKAFFLGEPLLFETNDIEAMHSTATDRWRNIDDLALYNNLRERVSVDISRVEPRC
jgi:hypothetical protein